MGKEIYVHSGRSDECKRSRGHVPTKIVEVRPVEELDFSWQSREIKEKDSARSRKL